MKELENKLLTERLNLNSMKKNMELKIKTKNKPKYCKKCKKEKKSKIYCRFCGEYFCKVCISKKRYSKKDAKIHACYPICDENFIKIYLFESFAKQMDLKT